MANFFASAPSQGYAERIEAGRRKMHHHLASIIGDGARVDATPAQFIDTRSGAMRDRFTAHIARPVSLSARKILDALAAEIFYGETTVRIDIDWSRYDTRWFASNWTSSQRTLGALVLLFALVLLVAAGWFEHYRVEHLGGANAFGNYTTDTALEAWRRLWDQPATATMSPVE